MGSGFSSCQGVSATSVQGYQGSIDNQTGFSLPIKTAWGRSRKLERGDVLEPAQGFHIKFHQSMTTSHEQVSFPESSQKSRHLDISDTFNLGMPCKMRPRSAHARKHRDGGNYERETMNGSVTSRTRKAAKLENMTDNGLATNDEDMDPDLLSIPDETLYSPRTKMKTCVDAFTHGIEVKSTSDDNVVEHEDWWGTLTPLESDLLTDRSRGNFASCKFWDNSVAKKASERSISSVILLTPIESPTHSAEASTLNSPLEQLPRKVTTTSYFADTISSSRNLLVPAPSPSSLTQSSATVEIHESSRLQSFRKVREGMFSKSRPDSGIAVSSATYSSFEESREKEFDVASETDWIACSLGMLQQVLAVRTEEHDSIKSLVKEITRGCSSDQLKAHALYRWLSSQHLGYYRHSNNTKSTVPTTKLRQMAEGQLSYASLYQEMARAAGLRCEKIEGYVKGKDYKPGMPIQHSANQHSWNAVSLNGHYVLIDSQYGSLPYKFFVEHFFQTPPDEFVLSHFPKDKKWLLMTQLTSINDFGRSLKTWPAMFAFNIRPLNMHCTLRTYDGRLSITVLLSNVAVTPMLEYDGPGPHIDSDALSLVIDQEIRNVDSAETFHVTLSQEGVYFFTLMVHDIEEDKDIPTLQYRIEYIDELL